MRLLATRHPSCKALAAAPLALFASWSATLLHHMRAACCMCGPASHLRRKHLHAYLQHALAVLPTPAGTRGHEGKACWAWRAMHHVARIEASWRIMLADGCARARAWVILARSRRPVRCWGAFSTSLPARVPGRRMLTGPSHPRAMHASSCRQLDAGADLAGPCTR